MLATVAILALLALVIHHAGEITRLKQRVQELETRGTDTPAG